MTKTIKYKTLEHDENGRPFYSSEVKTITKEMALEFRDEQEKTTWICENFYISAEQSRTQEAIEQALEKLLEA